MCIDFIHSFYSFYVAVYILIYIYKITLVKLDPINTAIMIVPYEKYIYIYLYINLYPHQKIFPTGSNQNLKQKNTCRESFEHLWHWKHVDPQLPLLAYPWRLRYNKFHNVQGCHTDHQCKVKSLLSLLIDSTVLFFRLGQFLEKLSPKT